MADVDPRTEHLPRHVLEQHEASLLTPDEAARVDTHVRVCARCGEALAAVRGARETFLAANPAGIRAAQLLARAAAARAPRASRWRWAWAVLPVAAAAAAVVLWLGRGPAPQVAPPQPDVIAKGGHADALPVSLRVRRAGGDGVTELAVPDTRFAAGDTLQLGVGDAARPHVVVLAVDAHGVVGEVFRGALAAPGELPMSLRLDATPDDEVLVVVAAATPLEPATLRVATEAAWRRAYTAGDLAGLRLALAPELGARWWAQVVRKETSPRALPGRSLP